MEILANTPFFYDSDDDISALIKIQSSIFCTTKNDQKIVLKHVESSLRKVVSFESKFENNYVTNGLICMSIMLSGINIDFFYSANNILGENLLIRLLNYCELKKYFNITGFIKVQYLKIFLKHGFVRIKNIFDDETGDLLCLKINKKL